MRVLVMFGRSPVRRRHAVADEAEQGVVNAHATLRLSAIPIGASPKLERHDRPRLQRR